MWTALLPIALAMLSLTACDRREAPDEPVSKRDTPTNTAPTAQYPSRSPTNMSDPSKGPGTDVTEKGGAETGMVGGASGTVGSGGKPGSGTSAGAGTGAAESSTSKEETKGK
jgi:hypothetical protein